MLDFKAVPRSRLLLWSLKIGLAKQQFSSVEEGTVICRLPGGDDSCPEWGIFSSPVKIFETNEINRVNDLLEKIEQETEKGRCVAGFISYEAAPAFDDAHEVWDIGDFPLLWFGIYDSYSAKLNLNDSEDLELSGNKNAPELAKEQYLQAIERIEKYILEGDIYQANFTFRSHFELSGIQPFSLFRALLKSHPVPYSAFINTGRHQLVSLSPELFLEKSGNLISSKPMKGTAHRQLSARDDIKAAEALADDPKNRAENIMIVDMVRNDLGRICELGSVKTGPIFQVDTYNTVHQMISRVQGTLPEDISFPDIFRAAFPAASITGAPKIRAMQIIKELEFSPRKVYTGSIGCIHPDGDFCFNVAIRTLICEGSSVELGIGSGIVADSDPLDEWRESLLKSSFVSRKLPEFELLETMLWRSDEGFVYRREHLERLRNSHIYFKWPYDEEDIVGCLDQKLKGFESQFAIVRLRTSQNGTVKVEANLLPENGWGTTSLKIKVSDQQTSSEDLFLYHKNTNRAFYNEQFKQARSEGFDEVVFTNEKGEVTEGAITNIFMRFGGKWFTPPIKCGLLPGVWRSAKIKELPAEERILNLEDLRKADEILLGNSVRGGGSGKLT